jgi:hypothetical protein
MEKTITSFGTDLKDRLLEGVKQLNDSVSSTLGLLVELFLLKDYIKKLKSLKMELQ